MKLVAYKKYAIYGVALFAISLTWLLVVMPISMRKILRHEVALKKGWPMRGLWEKYPFPLLFHIYVFNVTNPTSVSRGEKPALQQIGPFVYDEWIEKTSVQDHEEDDSVSYLSKRTYRFNAARSKNYTGDEEVVIPHLFAVGLINGVLRMKPDSIILVAPALDSILRKPESAFARVKVRDLLFDGLLIDCNVEDFAGAIACKEIADRYEHLRLKLVGKKLYALSFLGTENGTTTLARVRVKRGIRDLQDLTKIVSYDNRTKLDVWDDEGCDRLHGTDGSLFHPFLDRGGREHLTTYTPQFCRSLVARFEAKVGLRAGVQLLRYTTDLGVDGLGTAEHKCYCPGGRIACPRRGVFDLFKCQGQPLVISNPHFYLADPAFLGAIGSGLEPDKAKHAIEIDVDPLLGTPVRARLRFQLNIQLQPVQEVPLVQRFPEALLPLVWVDETLDLPRKFVVMIVAAHAIIGLSKLILMCTTIAGLGMCCYAGLLLYNEKRSSSSLYPNNGELRTATGNNGSGSVSPMSGEEKRTAFDIIKTKIFPNR
ncbi:hypothetical protein TKK_0005315 [Trichogramma kaykai]